MKRFECVPSKERFPEAAEFAENAANEAGVPLKLVMQANIAVDEIFSNIVSYSGADKFALEIFTEDTCSYGKTALVLRFYDNGTPFDPTKTPDPDTSLSSEEREIGGLGIFMVKRSMDKVEYKRENGMNVLTLKKSF